MIDKLNKWFRNFVFNFMYEFNLDEYHIAWISWLKGVIVGIIIGVLLF
jgi:hypothetical protein